MPTHASSPRGVLADLGVALARTTDARPAPGWLRPEQRLTCQQLLPILDQFHCALLADPVGSGKTWMALAVAQQWQHRIRPTVLAPAALVPQWRRTAEMLSVNALIWSHERVSRGGLPPTLLERAKGYPLVIVDESQHFRNPSIRRYRVLAPALMSRAVLLLSATPVVNRLSDLGAQLLLGASDDALRAYGIPSITRHLEETEHVTTAIGELVLISSRIAPGLPGRHDRKEGFDARNAEYDALLDGLDQLELSSSKAIAGLVRTVFWRAMASSPLAILAALRRYRALLMQAKDAREAGKRLTRTEIYGLAGRDLQQLVMWELWPEELESGDLLIRDLAPLEAAIDMAGSMASHPDFKVERLAGILADEATTLVFTGAKETVRYIRQNLGERRVAWCTGESAGIGRIRMPRESVLAWFRPGSMQQGGPRVLVTTDVAAEGLDLQGASRVIHYDLPWTPVRMDQRNGRSRRLGSSHSTVEVVRFDPYPPLEHRLAQLGILARKRKLPRKAGIDRHGARTWLWRSRIAMQYSGGGETSRSGASGARWCSIPAPFAGAIAGFEILALTRHGAQRVASVLGCLDHEGTWSQEPALIEHRMEFAATATWCEGPADGRVGALELLAPVIRTRMEELRHLHWVPPYRSQQATGLIERLNRLAVAMTRARDQRGLRSIEAGIRFVTRGHSAGEFLLADALAALPDDRLIQRLAAIPAPDVEPGTLYPRLSGLVLFHCEGAIHHSPTALCRPALNGAGA
ncbi:MAG: DEAD/DEAH box helicase [Gemmatimonadota bacterium]